MHSNHNIVIPLYQHNKELNKLQHNVIHNVIIRTNYFNIFR
jgi:hypothetical protein